MESTSSGGSGDDEVAELKRRLVEAEDDLKKAKDARANSRKIAGYANVVASVNNRIASLTSKPSVSKARRRHLYKKLSSSSTCRAYCDALAVRIRNFYSFHAPYPSSPTIGNVITAKESSKWSYVRYPDDGEVVDDEGNSVQVKKGDPILDKPLDQLFTDVEWRKLKTFNYETNKNVHRAELPTTASGKYFIIVPKKDFNQEMITFLKSVGVKSTFLMDPEQLEVKDETYLTESAAEEPSEPILT